MKQKIKIVLYAMVLITVAVAAQMIVNYFFRNEEQMVDAFVAADAKVVKSSLTMVGNFGVKYMTTEDKEHSIDYMASQLGIRDTLTKKTQKGTTTNCITATVKGEKTKTKIESISIKQIENSGVEETKEYLYVTIDIYEDVGSILHYKKLTEEAMQEMNAKSIDSAVALKGSYDKKLSLSDKNKIVAKLMQTLQGNVVTKKVTKDLYTIYAYTPVIGNVMQMNGDRINVNIAFSYDEENDQTIMYMASPVINEDY